MAGFVLKTSLQLPVQIKSILVRGFPEWLKGLPNSVLADWED